MSKGLEELKRLAYENACCRCQYYIDNKCSNKYECVWKTIEKELKALEIIKEKPQATLWLIQVCDKEMEYEDMISLFKEDITKEQFDLLKEIFYGLHTKQV